MNSLEIIFRQRLVTAVPDRQYRVMIRLIRSDMPNHWNFLCFSCGSKICEIVNRDVFDVNDFYDIENTSNSGLTRHCKGTLDNGLPCKYSYFFNFM